MLLDEPTSSLDSQNEERVMKVLSQLKTIKKKTILMITHRLHLNSFTDTVVYISKDGIEQGSHSSMIADRTTKYASLWENFLQID